MILEKYELKEKRTTPFKNGDWCRCVAIEMPQQIKLTRSRLWLNIDR